MYWGNRIILCNDRVQAKKYGSRPNVSSDKAQHATLTRILPPSGSVLVVPNRAESPGCQREHVTDGDVSDTYQFARYAPSHVSLWRGSLAHYAAGQFVPNDIISRNAARGNSPIGHSASVEGLNTIRLWKELGTFTLAGFTGGVAFFG
jgi:hypothetical protein